MGEADHEATLRVLSAVFAWTATSKAFNYALSLLVDGKRQFGPMADLRPLWSECPEWSAFQTFE